MKKLKIYTDGALFYAGQQDRINKGFLDLGHELVSNPEDAELIYSNNPSKERSILVEKKKNGKLKGKLILNILDIPYHIWDNFKQCDLQLWSDELKVSDGITVISDFVKVSVLHTFGFSSDVIYQPIKPIRKIPATDKKFKYLFIGRKTDPNKNVISGIRALQMLGVEELEVGMIGNENIGWGTYLGAISDEKLNQYYNNADFVFCLGFIEGINLSCVEAMAAGAIPVVLRDLTTREEWLPEEKFPEYLEVSREPVSVVKFLAQFLADNNKMEQMKQRLFNHYKYELEVKFTPTAVAHQILKVFNATKSE